MGWKKAWWQCVACPEDVENEQAFRQGMTRSAAVSVTLRLVQVLLQPCVLCGHTANLAAAFEAVACSTACLTVKPATSWVGAVTCCS